MAAIEMKSNNENGSEDKYQRNQMAAE